MEQLQFQKLKLLGIEADTITIKEIQAPDGYEKLIGTIQLQVTKEVQGDTYIVKSVTIAGEEVDGIKNPTIVDNVIQVTIPNKKITGSYELQLVKVDANNPETTLEGAEFKVTLPDKTEKILTTNDRGIIEISPIEITRNRNT